MTVLVTGGAGFIGSHVVEKLIDQDEEVVCLDNFDPFYDPGVKRRNLSRVATHSRFHLVEGDIRDRRLLEKTFSDYPITHIFHAAAKAGVRPSIQDPLGYEAVNIEGTLGLLEMARKQPTMNFVFASSSSVYGNSRHLPFAEDQPLGIACSPYGATKQTGELFCATYHLLYRLPVIGLRFFTVYGPRQRPEMAIHKFCRLIDEGKPVPVYGDGTSQRDFTYIDDAVEGVMRALAYSPEAGSKSINSSEKKSTSRKNTGPSRKNTRPSGKSTGPSGRSTGPSGQSHGSFGKATWLEMVNIGEAQTIELKALIELLEEGLGKRAKLEYLPVQAGDVQATHADLRKAKRLLNYHPGIRIQEGIQNFIEWYRQEGRETQA